MYTAIEAMGRAVVTLVFSLIFVLWQTLNAAKTNPAMERKKE